VGHEIWGGGLAVTYQTPPALEERPFGGPDLSEARAALQRLQQRIAEQCPGEHRYVRNRDDRPPACPHCRFTDVGLRLDEYSRGTLK
jgi:hypothetical protein